MTGEEMAIEGAESAPPKKGLFKPWMVLVPIPVILWWCYYHGISSWVAFGALVGVAAGWWLGGKIPPRSVVHVLCLDLENKRARILEMGRKFFSGVEKIGRPWLTLETGLGFDLIVARTYDDVTKTLTYPEDAEYSDAVIMAIPARYRELISSLVELRDRVADQDMEIDLRAQRKAAELVDRFRELFTDACYPEDAEDRE